MKEDMSLSNLGTVALHASKVPTNVFSSTLICILTLDYFDNSVKTTFSPSKNMPMINAGNLQNIKGVLCNAANIIMLYNASLKLRTTKVKYNCNFNMLH